jgi:hypothetical protein
LPNPSWLAASCPDLLEPKEYDPFLRPSTYLASSLVGADDRTRWIPILELVPHKFELMSWAAAENLKSIKRARAKTELQLMTMFR